MPALRIRTDIAPEELRRLACREDDARVAVYGVCWHWPMRSRHAASAGGKGGRHGQPDTGGLVDPVQPWRRGCSGGRLRPWTAVPAECEGE